MSIFLSVRLSESSPIARLICPFPRPASPPALIWLFTLVAGCHFAALNCRSLSCEANEYTLSPLLEVLWNALHARCVPLNHRLDK